MQLFVNNWVTTLQAPVAAADLEITVEVDQAAKLIGLGSGDHYVVTAAAKDSSGNDVIWEVMKVTGRAAGVLTVEREQEGTVAAELMPAGTQIMVGLTAATAAEMIAAGGAGGALTKANFGQKIGNLSLANPGNFAYFDRDIGELLFANFGLLVPYAPETQSFGFSAIGRFESDGEGAGVTNAGNGFMAHTGVTADGYVTIEIGDGRIADEAVKAALGMTADGFVSADGIGSVAMGVQLVTAALSTPAQEYRLRVLFSFLEFQVSVVYDRLAHGANWVVSYSDADYDEQLIVSSTAVAASAWTTLSVLATPAESGLVVAVKAGSATLATLNTDTMAFIDARGMGAAVGLEKQAGTTDITLQPVYAYGRVTLT